MSFVDTLRERLPSLLPLLMLILVGMGNLIFCMVVVVPHWQTYSQLTTQTQAAQTEIESRSQQQDSDGTLRLLQEQVTSGDNQRKKAAVDFLTQDQANEIFNLMYRYAADSGVSVTNLQTQQPDQTADTTSYGIEGFRLQVEGSFTGLIDFMKRFREAGIRAVAINQVNIQSNETNSTLVMDVLSYHSSYTSGTALEGLPPADAPIITSVPEIAVTPLPDANAFGPEPSLDLLYSDNFDTGTLYTWTMGPSWSLGNSEGGKALHISDSGEQLTFLYDNLRDVAFQARLQVSNGSARLTVRQSAAGGYTAALEPNGQIALYRGDFLVRSAPIPALNPDQWYTLRLSVVQGIARVALDGTPYLALNDTAELPQGKLGVALVGDGTLSVDNVEIWVPKDELGSK